MPAGRGHADGSQTFGLNALAEPFPQRVRVLGRTASARMVGRALLGAAEHVMPENLGQIEGHGWLRKSITRIRGFRAIKGL
jgi:hypothetical protein